ncbi:uncharacterized protein LOC135703480 [Ochlerotatus camptorhynchus]|uniref:uncharacterized protein LOC135703480 n=1 Tax=Ochlerotatus camptorhynchus TaxID=644619 RepID=UPI0031DEC573
MPRTTTAKKEQSLRPLETRLNSFLEMFKQIYKFAESMDEQTSAFQVSVRLEKLEELWEDVNEAIVDIESHEDYSGEDGKCAKERSEFIHHYFDVKSSLLEKAKELEEVPALNQSRVLDVTQSTLEHVRLPQIKLQTFDGNIDEWLSFRDLYTSLIHWKPDLPDVEKFHYLKGCLSGEAKALVDPLSITKANYQVAWETLTKRYNDSKLLKRRQVQALFKLPSLAKESVSELQSLLEGFERIIQNLDQLVQPQDYKDLLLLDILGSRLDPVTRRGWEEYSASKDQDSVKDLTEFLQKRVRVLSSLPSKPVELKGDSAAFSKKKFPVARTSHNVVQASGGRCVACSEVHLLYQCPSFQRLTVSARDKLLRNHSLCRNCFRRGHQASECSSRFVCRNCKAKHHTMVCFRSERSDGTKGNAAQKSTQADNSNAVTAEQNPNPTTSSAMGAVSSNMARRQSSSVLLATAVVLVENDQGISFPARTLLDSGSECNFMTEGLCQRLNIQRRRSDISVLGIGQSNTRVRHKITAKVKSRVSGFSRDMEFLILPRVTVNLPTTDVQATGWEFPEGVELADPAFFNSKAVDMILGIQYFFAFFNTGNEIQLGNGFPTLTESVFGWVVSGLVNTDNPNPRFSCNMAVTEGLEEILTRFWACEEIESPNNYSPTEARCEEHYSRTVRRGTDGRYTVSLPKDETVLTRMGESRDIAFRRLQGIERRLLREPRLREQYDKFMEEYLELGHMRKVDVTAEGDASRCYLPHHPVVKESSTTTKVRVVFDASCKTSSGVSLNDALLAGPVIQDDLRSIILRSRIRQILMVADAEKMFRQIWVDWFDMVFQCILWRNDFNERAETYELCTVTYGTKPAPYLATRTLKQLAMDEKTRFPMTARAAMQDVYMDDVLTGEDDEDTAKQLRIQLDQMMESGGFRLRKWASNSAAVLEGIPEDNLALSKEGIQLDPDPAVKSLGLLWLPTSDVFKFEFKIPEVGPNEQLSKRKLLSMIATLFDPLGLIGAVIVKAKIFMQRLWCLMDEEGRKLGWDQQLASKECEEWLRFHRQIPLLNEIAIQRCIVLPKATSVQLHFFSDASKLAYGACAYVRSIDALGNCLVALLTSKSKVAPLKLQSIPRLELCGALLAAQLKEKVLSSLKIETETFFWVDSTCVLQWLKAIPSTWTTFVANRVAKIQHATENCMWNHVQGVENPADLISRGLLPEEIGDNQLWWEGPSWLKQKQDCWPNQSAEIVSDEVEEEIRKSTVHFATSKPEGFGTTYVRRFSSFADMVCPEERRKAEIAVIRCVQREEFEKEWKALTKKEPVARSSSLRWFNPQLSRDNVIRQGIL